MTSAAVSIATIAIARSPNATPPIERGAICKMPLCPPVRLSASTSVCSTIRPKAIVTIARYGPFTRRAGKASSAPIPVAITTPIGQAIQKGSQPRDVQIATVYAPMA